MLTAGGLSGSGSVSFITSEGLPVFRNGSTTNGLTWAGEPVFGLPAAGGGDVSASLTGIESTAALGSLGSLHANTLAGLEATGALGTLYPALAVTPAGQAATAAGGALFPALTVSVAGQAATAAGGSTTPALASLLGGQQATAAGGSVTTALAALLGGQQVSAELGAPTVAISAALASAVATLALGDLTAYATQLARPAEDISDGTWTPSTGADLYATIDEVDPADDGDYDTSTDPSSDAFEVKLSSLVDPAVHTGHVVRYRLAGVDGTVNFVVSLRQGASTEIASWSHNGVTSVTTFTQTLSEAEAGNITDYSDLRIRFVATKV